MESLQSKLDVIANDLANINTTGLKAGRANFEDLFYRTEELLIDLITTQRTFELNSRAIQAGDQILQAISNLDRL